MSLRVSPYVIDLCLLTRLHHHSKMPFHAPQFPNRTTAQFRMFSQNPHGCFCFLSSGNQRHGKVTSKKTVFYRRFSPLSLTWPCQWVGARSWLLRNHIGVGLSSSEESQRGNAARVEGGQTMLSTGKSWSGLFHRILMTNRHDYNPTSDRATMKQSSVGRSLRIWSHDAMPYC